MSVIKLSELISNTEPLTPVSGAAAAAAAASGAAGLRTARLVFCPDEETFTAAGVETITGAFLSKPCWLAVLDTDDCNNNRAESQKLPTLYIKTTHQHFRIEKMRSHQTEFAHQICVLPMLETCSKMMLISLMLQPRVGGAIPNSF